MKNNLKYFAPNHQYFLGDKELISVTQLMAKHGLAPKYDGVPAEVLQAAAERGTLIHKEIEDFNKNGEIGFTQELINYIKYIKDNQVNVLQSEYMLHNDIVAGTCDLIIANGASVIMADIKTTSILHKDAVSWQLSIYLWLYLDYDKREPAKDYDGCKAKAFHFDTDGTLKVVDIPLKPIEEVKRLMDCERNGELYTQQLTPPLTELLELAEIETTIANLEKQKKAAETHAQEVRQALIDAMEKNGVTSWSTPIIQVTYIAPTTRASIDAKALRADLPAIADKYTKTSNIKASLRITLREGL